MKEVFIPAHVELEEDVQGAAGHPAPLPLLPWHGMEEQGPDSATPLLSSG